jgi:hypothetical protein
MPNDLDWTNEVEQGETGKFYTSVPVRAEFASIAAAERFLPLPSGWVVGITDLVDSTGLIAAGRYKTVNMIGASVVSAMINTLGGRPFPYVFGGDGASFAVPPEDAEIARSVLAVLRRWAGEEFEVALRAAVVPVDDIRAAGHDVRVARYAASSRVDYGMFAGGGVAWATGQMKAGHFAVPPADPPAIPDLTGLSCRWSNTQAKNGCIVSLVVAPGPGGDETAFATVARDLVFIADGLSRNGHPVPAAGPGVRWPPPGLDLEAHVSRAGGSLNRRRVQLLAQNLLAWLLFKTGLRVGGFDPTRYAADVSSNADYRKLEDGLKMTLDCDPATLVRLRAALEEAQAAGHIRFGLVEQDEAMVTCFVPSVLQDDHVHFVDGAAGGYARAAAQIKGV